MKKFDKVMTLAGVAAASVLPLVASAAPVAALATDDLETSITNQIAPLTTVGLLALGAAFVVIAIKWMKGAAR